MPDICYWCGEPATSKEHVPSFNLFPKGKKTNLITVPACKEHNENLTKLDEKFRVYLQARETSPDALNEFKDRTIRGLSRPQSTGFVKGLAAGSQRVRVNGQATIAMKVNPEEQNLYFEKIVRGLYFHIYKTPARGRVATISQDFLVPGFDYRQLADIEAAFQHDPSIVDGNTSNPDIFRFHYARFNVRGEETFAVSMIFYDGVKVLGFITNAAISGAITTQ